ncbi:MAG: AAA family ATPase [Gammaproteobacteria bacterium]|nr:AAA family ATPase [Gammaproteobacteria bacterium]
MNPPEYLDQIDHLLGDEPAPTCNRISALELLTREIPPRRNLLSPWLAEQSISMIYAPRGIGKTHVSMGITVAAGSGGSFLGWKAERPVKVCFIDGEMPLKLLQERLSYAITDIGDPGSNLWFVTPDIQAAGMPDISSAKGQELLAPHIKDADLIVVDNLSTLVRSGKENDGDSWQPIQTWALHQRAAGKSVLLIHHSGKSGDQRGTSRREDVLDCSIELRRPGDYDPKEGARFEIHFRKARGLYGDDVAATEAALITTATGSRWEVKTVAESTAQAVARLLSEGMKQHEIAEELCLSKGAVSKAKKRAQSLGLIVVDGGRRDDD